MNIVYWLGLNDLDSKQCVYVGDRRDALVSPGRGVVGVFPSGKCVGLVDAEWFFGLDCVTDTYYSAFEYDYPSDLRSYCAITRQVCYGVQPLPRGSATYSASCSRLHHVPPR